MKSGKILVVDDDESMRRVIEYNLHKHGYTTVAAKSAEDALDKLEEADFDLMISDMKMPGLSGMELIERVRRKNQRILVIFITAYGTIEMAVEAMKKGAYDYITKPFETDEFILTIEKAFDYHRLKNENIRLRSKLDSQDFFKNIIGASNGMQGILNTVDRVANTDATVLITGASGVGKELIARAIHLRSDRSAQTMITINCAAIPRDLLESELFGHTKGAFTGAVKDKDGKFIAANGSTIFLDEIGDLHPELQAKLLRVLQDHVVEPLGSDKPIPVDIRVIAATNQDLRAKVEKNEFREDLFYRLNVIPIEIPPLKERPEDIPMLIAYFLNKFSEKSGVSIENGALELLTEYTWPGNVRELENVIKRVVILRRGAIIKAADLPPEIIQETSKQTERNEKSNGTSLVENEIKLITDALKNTGWNQSKAAKLLKIPRHVLIYRMKKYGIREQ